ncbi:VanW family protein [Paenibacillus sp. GSMTC-2017]|uniref:VanW family protein n=1 Tax=Paenibacillus sp. GSMTC-2017 TaxID=2794350 RepID=UPI0018D73D43|nr:VanW family protein [Paenibacillus sp. GSMTC-2017]MBH5317047.1 VanW family protein [Paenibacillus sp. GSMTC-2017]
MGWNWLLGMLLIVQQSIYPNLIIEHQGERVLSEVSRDNYIYKMPGIPLVNDEQLEQLMDEVAKKVEREPVNATLDGYGKVIPEVPGNKLDRLAFRQLFYGYIIEGTSSTIEVPLRKVYPRVDSEVLSSIKGRLIGQYTTYYNKRNKNRSSNIVLSAHALNNYVVFPGERFSFNFAVGERTRQKGYLRAPVIVRGELYEDIGGGICQVSSTLFNAVDRAGLTIVERFSHSRSVHYVPSGRDATVSWYGPDFVFENPYDHPILIRTYANAGQVSVSITSSELVALEPREVPGASKELPEEVKLDERNTIGE